MDQIRLFNGRYVSSKDLRDIDALIIRSVTKVDQKLLCDSSVKFIGTVTSGIDHIDQNYLIKNNIKYVSALGRNAISVVEYVFSALFWLSQRDHFFLRDKTVGIVGVGKIGNLLYQRLNKFGVNTLLCDPYLSKLDSKRSWKSLETLVSESDILTFHTPLTYVGNYPTWHMVDQDFLDALPTGMILINTARGKIIDNKALLKVLQCGKKINVVLDVWESEPNLSLPLLSYVDIGTAHIAGHTVESKIRSMTHIYNMYCDYFNILNKINTSVLLSSNINYSYFRVKKVDEYIINQFIKIVYNIYSDHIALKYFSSNLEAFDKLKKLSLFRREWSSLFINAEKDYNNEILMNLGFNVLY